MQGRDSIPAQQLTRLFPRETLVGGPSAYPGKRDAILGGDLPDFHFGLSNTWVGVNYVPMDPAQTVSACQSEGT